MKIYLNLANPGVRVAFSEIVLEIEPDEGLRLDTVL